MVEANQLPPGCEEFEELGVKSCSKELKMRVVTRFGRHKAGGAVNAVAVLTDGVHAISGGDDTMIYKWKIRSGKVMEFYDGHKSAVLSLSVFPDAAYFCGASHETAIAWRVYGIHDQEQGPSIWPVSVKGEPVGINVCVALSEFESAMIGQDNGLAQLWKWSRGRTMQVPSDPTLMYNSQIQIDADQFKWPNTATKPWIPTGLETKFVASRKRQFGLNTAIGGRRLRSSNSSRFRFRRLRSSNSTRRRPRRHPDREKPLEERAGPAAPWTNYFSNLVWGDVPTSFLKSSGWGPVISMVALPGKQVVSAGYQDGGIRTFRTYNGFFEHQIKAHDGAVNALAAAPVGANIYSGGGDGLIHEWDSANGWKPVKTFYAAYAGPCTALAMVPGGGALYAGYADGTVLLWNIGTAEVMCSIDTGGGVVKSLSVNPELVGQVLVASEQGYVFVYEQR